MTLKQSESNVSTILQSLKDEKEEERSKAALRLGQLLDDVNEVEITGIIDALNEARNIEESSTLESRIETVLNIYTKAEKETERRKEEEAARRKEEAAAREKSEQQIAEEGEELDSFTYKSRESSKRFPANTLLIDVYRLLACLAIGAGVLMGLLLLDELGLGIMLVGVVIGINMLLVSEMIRFLMDFHDANYINTKVRIKTLEALQEISKKLRKP